MINDLVDLNDQLYFLSMDRYFMDDNDPMQDEVDHDCFLVMEACKSSHYMFRAPNYRKSHGYWQDFFDESMYNDDEFREHFRLSRNSFMQLYNIIRDHPIFTSTKKR